MMMDPALTPSLPEAQPFTFEEMQRHPKCVFDSPLGEFYTGTFPALSFLLICMPLHIGNSKFGRNAALLDVQGSQI